MDDMEQAHHELSRLQEIVSRHEGHMDSLRGWLLGIIGGLLAAYYTSNIDSVLVLRIALLLIVAIFLIVETRYVNLVESVVERVGHVEKQIRDAHRQDAKNSTNWFDGPKVNEACKRGARRRWPRGGMTFVLNQWVYYAVILVVILTTVALPARHVAVTSIVEPSIRRLASSDLP
jgi:hypothetical protein